MKLYIKILLLTAFLPALMSCEDMDRYPLTEITVNDFFKTGTDLETYTNSFYGYLSTVYSDVGSDDVAISTNANQMYTMVNSDGISPDNVSGWYRADWTKLRNINYFLMNVDPAVVSATAEDVRHYIGIARFFRANFYYDKVKNYSDVPWYNKAMESNDEDMYKASDPRTLVVDSIMNDLQYAVDCIKTDLGTRTRINKYAALALMARVCLHEGTYRKYHTGLGLESTATTYLDKALWAAEQIMNSGIFELYGNSAAHYGEMFCSEKLRDNPEMILVDEMDAALGRANNTHTVLGMYWGLSRSLMEDYQTNEGKPYEPQKAGGEVKTYLEVFEGRDPRLAETFMYPGFKESPISSPKSLEILRGGYNQLKFYPKDENLRKGWNQNYTSLPLFRYGEILLIYAEAKAEKGTLTQDDLNKSVNLLRKRVGMPDIVYSSEVLTDIRRERRIELACEGFRLDDIKRWAQGSLLGAKPQAIYIHKLGAFDATGDGEVDTALLPSPDDKLGLSDEELSKLTVYYLLDSSGKSTGIYLSGADGKSGYIEFDTSRNRLWQDKFYYTPVPRQQTILNPNLKQPPGWN